MTRYNVISADSHVIEPGDLWLKYSDPAFRERAPRIVRRDGTDHYEVEGGISLLSVPLASGAGKPPDQRHERSRAIRIRIGDK